MSFSNQNSQSIPRDTFIAEVNNSEVKQVESNIVSNVNKIIWILDSGCTDHIVNQDNVFENYIELKNAVNVRLGNGRELKATKIGQLKDV